MVHYKWNQAALGYLVPHQHGGLQSPYGVGIVENLIWLVSESELT